MNGARTGWARRHAKTQPEQDARGRRLNYALELPGPRRVVRGSGNEEEMEGNGQTNKGGRRRRNKIR